MWHVAISVAYRDQYGKRNETNSKRIRQYRKGGNKHHQLAQRPRKVVVSLEHGCGVTIWPYIDGMA
jgi:hypothetical protein